MKNYLHKTQAAYLAGFTLIEMVVSLGVFSIALLISISAILSVSAAQKKAVALQNAEDNFRFSFEAISKEIRTGRDFFCDNVVPPPGYTPKNCTGGNRLLTFQNARGQTVSYEYKNDSGRLQKTVDRLNTTFLTSPLVHITDFKFYVVGTDAVPADLSQPRVTMLLNGTAGVSAAEQVILRLQTTVSQRRLDN